ncbi:thioredoxin domain-containing protein [bacterium]|nr:thioredoxin domain-containing protein [bacterium]
MSKKKKRKKSNRGSRKQRSVAQPKPQPPEEAVPTGSTRVFPISSFWTVLAAGLIGVGLALYASYQTMEIRWQGLVNPSACSVNSWINCDAAHASSYAFAFSLPIAWWGFLYYLWMICLVSWSFFLKEKARFPFILAWGSSFVALGFTITKAIALFQLKTLCLVCIGMYAINLFLFWIFQRRLGLTANEIVQSIREIFASEADSLPLWRPSFLFSTLAAVIFVGGLFLAKHIEASYYDKEPIDVAAEVVKHFEREKINATVHPNAPVWGNPNAAVTLVEFSDFQCPYCQKAAFHLRAMLWEFRDQIRLYFMNFPLDHTINRFCRGPIHKYAGLAARAAVCAQERGKFWEFHDELFRRQQDLDEEVIMSLCEQFGWSKEEFLASMNADDTYQRVRAEIECSGDKVRSTPTLIINGRMVEYWGHPEVVQEIVREEIRRSQS